MQATKSIIKKKANTSVFPQKSNPIVSQPPKLNSTASKMNGIDTQQQKSVPPKFNVKRPTPVAALAVASQLSRDSTGRFLPKNSQSSEPLQRMNAPNDFHRHMLQQPISTAQPTFYPSNGPGCRSF